MGLRLGWRVYGSKRWKRLRFFALRRDGFQCVKCGARADLECDHIKPLRTHPELAYELSNLQSLCVPCHSEKTNAEMGRRPLAGRSEWRNLVLELSKKGNAECLSQ
jgi:5-methylcytosine-specific restriction protein A